MGGFGTSSFHLSRRRSQDSPHALRDKVRPGDPVGEMPSGVVVIMVAALIAAATSLIYVVLRAVPHIFSLLSESVPSQTAQAMICGCAALAIGAFLYQLRTRNRGIYALSELSFAFVSAALAMSKLKGQGDAAVWLAFAAAAYLVVRGCDNVSVARSAKAWPWSLLPAESSNTKATAEANA